MKNIQYLILFSFAIFLFSSCEEEVPAGMDEMKDKAKVVFVNAAPDIKAPVGGRTLAIYPYYDGKIYNLQPVQFPWGNVYMAFDPGTIAMRLDTARASNGTIPGAQGKVKEFNISVEKDSYYSVYAIGSAQNIDYMFMKDDLSLPTPGKVKVRFLNLSADAGKIDIVNATTNTPFVTGLEYKSNSGFIEMTPGDFANVRIKDSSTEVLISPANRRLLLEANMCYTVWATGVRNPAPGVTHKLMLAYFANRYNFVF